MSSKQDGGAAKLLKPYICGGASAMFASFVVHPIDLTKVRLQLVGEGSTGKRPSAIAVARDVMREGGGVRALYAGLSAALMRQATYGTARIGLFTAFSDYVKAHPTWGGASGENLPFAWKFATSFASGAVASAIGNPFDVALVRMQSDSMRPAAQRRNYSGVINAVSRITREEGFGTLYRGYPPTLLRAISMNIGMMASYEQIKETLVSAFGTGLHTELMASAGAGFCCALLSLPADMLKTRLQNMKALPDGTVPYKGLFDCAIKIVKSEGPLALWSGFGAYYARCAPHAMIILLTREQLTRAYDRNFC